MWTCNTWGLRDLAPIFAYSLLFPPPPFTNGLGFEALGGSSAVSQTPPCSEPPIKSTATGNMAPPFRGDGSGTRFSLVWFHLLYLTFKEVFSKLHQINLCGYYHGSVVCFHIPHTVLQLWINNSYTCGCVLCILCPLHKFPPEMHDDSAKAQDGLLCQSQVSIMSWQQGPTSRDRWRYAQIKEKERLN